ncbi:WXG100 family type VII secretion target [Mycobacterium sp. D16R24]|uniref:WXG100 family type VII secretion target n=1 Tax=Mycobacterium sp. D16R24 TaxID=1855656 RepID=UPI0009938F36|nr:WXG100 family type VII secretion target [Mycobacterium sp. D16R24]
MIDRLVFDSEHIDNTSRALTEYGDHVAEAVHKVTAEVDRSEQSFQGLAGDQFRENTREWLKAAAELKDVLGEMSKWLAGVGQAYDDARAVNRSMFD